MLTHSKARFSGQSIRHDACFLPRVVRLTLCRVAAMSACFSACGGVSPEPAAAGETDASVDAPSDATADAGLISAFGLGTYGDCRESGNVGAGALGSATLVLEGTMLTLVFSAPDYDRPKLTLEFDLTSPTSGTLTAPRQLVPGFPRCPLPSLGVSPPQPDASFASYGSLTYNASTLFVSATLVLADGGYAGCGGLADLTIACTRGDGG